VKIAQNLSFPKGSIIVMDRGYVDYALFARWKEEGVWFVSRQKGNANYTVIEERPVPTHRSIVADQLIALLILKYMTFRSHFGWSLSNLVAMLRYNLFTYRELWAWLDSPYEVPPLLPSGEQLVLGF